MERIFEANPKQLEAFQYLQDKETTEIGYGGAGHGGKSWLECFYLASMCDTYPDTGWLLGRKELLNLRRTTLLTFYKVCQEYKWIPNKHFKLNQQTNIIDWWNGSQIFLFDLAYQPSDPLFTRLGGLELTGAAIDESNEVPILAIDIVKTRIGRRKNAEYGLTPKLIEGFNPEKTHIYVRYYKPWKDGTLPKHRKFIRALPTDNPYTTEDYLNQLRNADKITRERLLYGNFEYDDDPTALIGYEAMVDLFTNTVEDSNEKYMTVDVARFGVDKTVIKLWRGFRVYKVYIYAKQGTEITEQKIREIAKTEQIPYSHIVIDEDGIGGGVVDHLPGVKGFMANSSALPTKAQPDVKPNYKNLKAQCSYLLADMVNTHAMAVDNVIVSEVEGVTGEVYEQHLIEELEQIKAKDPDKDDAKLQIVPKDEVKEKIQRSPDYSDALMMRMLFELKKPVGNIPTGVQGGAKPMDAKLGF